MRTRLLLGCALGLVALLGAAGALAHPPTLAGVPPSMTVNATSPAGAVVTYALPTTTHPPPVRISCSPESGTIFPFGRTTVVCLGTDQGTNETTTATFAVTVVDTLGPVLSGLPAALGVEATGPRGATVGYTLPGAVDAVDGPRPVECRPPPRTLVAIGTATVTCRAVDTRGNVGEAKLAVSVRDTRGPVFQRVPADISRQVDGPGPVKISYRPPIATDTVDGRIGKVECDPAPGASFPIGATTVTCTASDSADNESEVSFEVELTDSTAPPAVGRLAGKTEGKAIELTWRLSESLDVAGVQLTRFPGRGGAKSTVLLDGLATSYSDDEVRAGVRYRYVAVTYDYAGNRSAGVGTAMTLLRPSRFTPPDATRVTGPPLMRWPTVAGASYYNFQLFRRGVKILSIWPAAPRLQLRPAWTYGGKSYRLTAGPYRWFVWAGFGPLRLARYGPLLGQNSFVLVAPDVGA